MDTSFGIGTFVVYELEHTQDALLVMAVVPDYTAVDGVAQEMELSMEGSGSNMESAIVVAHRDIHERTVLCMVVEIGNVVDELLVDTARKFAQVLEPIEVDPQRPPLDVGVAL